MPRLNHYEVTSIVWNTQDLAEVLRNKRYPVTQANLDALANIVRKSLQDRLCEKGYDVIDTLLAMEGPELPDQRPGKSKKASA